MAKGADKKSSKVGDKLVEKAYGDYNLYDWSGKQVDKGSDVRRKGSDR